MKKFLSLFMTAAMMLSIIVPVSANDSVKIKVDGKELTDAQAILKDGSTLLPVRSVGNALGGEIIWDAATKTVVVTKGSTTVVMPVGEKYIIVGDNVVQVSTPAQVINGRTYVPLRVLGDALDCGVSWVNETKTVEIKSKEVKQNKDLFANNNSNVPYFMVDGVYLTEGEIVPVPVVGGNWVQWSDKRKITCEWSFYNNQQVILITGLSSGTSALKIYNSSSQKGLIEGDYTEIKVHVVGENNKNYQKQREQRIASGFDILANQEDFINREERVKEKYGLNLEGVKDITYAKKNGVLVIPIDSKKEVTGRFELMVKAGSGIQAVMDEYNGKPAIFIKGSQTTATDVIVKYTNNTDDVIFTTTETTDEPDILWEREFLRTNEYYNSIETAMWNFRLRIVNGSDTSYKAQEKERVANGISYDLYLNGQA